MIRTIIVCSICVYGISMHADFIYNACNKKIWIQKLIYTIHYLGSPSPYEQEDCVIYKARTGFRKYVFKPFLLDSQEIISLLPLQKNCIECYLVAPDNNDLTNCRWREFIRQWQPLIGGTQPTTILKYDECYCCSLREINSEITYRIAEK